MQETKVKSQGEPIGCEVEEEPGAKTRTAVVELYAVSGDEIKLMSFYVRVNRSDQEDTPLRRLIAAERSSK